MCFLDFFFKNECLLGCQSMEKKSKMTQLEVNFWFPSNLNFNLLSIMHKQRRVLLQLKSSVIREMKQKRL